MMRMVAREVLLSEGWRARSSTLSTTVKCAFTILWSSEEWTDTLCVTRSGFANPVVVSWADRLTVERLQFADHKHNGKRAPLRPDAQLQQMFTEEQCAMFLKNVSGKYERKTLLQTLVHTPPIDGPGKTLEEFAPDVHWCYIGSLRLDLTNVRKLLDNNTEVFMAVFDTAQECIWRNANKDPECEYGRIFRWLAYFGDDTRSLADNVKDCLSDLSTFEKLTEREYPINMAQAETLKKILFKAYWDARK